MTELSNRFIKLKYDAYHYIGDGETQTIVQKLGFRNKAVFECIASHQDETCHSDITQQQISKLTGIGLTTVNTAIQELKEFTYEGKPIIEIKSYYEGKRQRNLYKILPNILVSQYNERVSISNFEIQEEKQPTNISNFEIQNEVNISKFEKQSEVNISKFEKSKEINNKEINNKNITLEVDSLKRMSNKEIVSYFKNLLKEIGIDEKINYPQIMSKMKKVEHLFDGMLNNDIKKVCSIIINEYGSSIKTDLTKYPLNIHVLTRGWVIERAKDILSKEKQSLSQMKEQSVEASKRNEVAISSIMSRIKRKGGQRNV